MDFNARGDSRQQREHADGKVRMPFGKYKDKPLDEIPDSYLLWVLDNVDMNDRPTLREVIRDRLGLNRPKGETPNGPNLESIIKIWFRTLALDFHPDKRGSHDAMIAINEAHHRLRKMLKL